MGRLAELQAELKVVNAQIRRLAPNGFCPKCMSITVKWRYVHGVRMLCKDGVGLHPHVCRLPSPPPRVNTQELLEDGFKKEN